VEPMAVRLLHGCHIEGPQPVPGRGRGAAQRPAARAGLRRGRPRVEEALPHGDQPRRPQSRGLAAALEVSIDRIAVAALRSAGVPVTDRFAAGDVLEGLDQLTPSQRAAIQRLVEVMINPTTP
jgi:hypothetical protein